MISFFRKLDATVKELWIGIAVWGVFVSLVAFWVASDRVRCLAGIWLGCLMGAAGVFHMWSVLDRALDLGAGAQRYLTIRSLARYGIFVLLFICLAVTGWADPFAAFFGLIGMKAAAYLQPAIHKALEKRM